MRTTVQMLILASAAVAASGYPMVSSSKRYGAWLPFRAAHPPPPPTYIETFNPPSQEELVDFYNPPAEPPLRYYQVPYYYYGLPEYYYETNEDDMEPEQWYVGSNAEANALFLHNLMLAQLYSRAQNEDNMNGGEKIWPRTRDTDIEEDDQEDVDTYVYGEPVKSVSPLSKEDRDVRELKSLVENRWVDKREGENKLVTRNQVRQEYKPSAYDAIKKLLIQQEKKDSEKRQPHKRSYSSNEDSLVEQLGSLKKI